MMGPLLLDTCAALWIVAGDASPQAERLLLDALQARQAVYVSPITAWEIGILAGKGRFRSPYTPQRWFEELMRKPNAVLAELTPKILIESSLLPNFRKGDPADRIIAATAREFGFTVMTRDQSLLAYAAEGHLSAVEC